jgi:hypothetical protein
MYQHMPTQTILIADDDVLIEMPPPLRAAGMSVLPKTANIEVHRRHWSII